MENNLAPIVLFVYNRPLHTRKVLEALSKNVYADKSKLFIYADGPKPKATEEQLLNMQKVRALIREKKWCSEVFIIERDKNMGLSGSIVAGVTDIVNEFGKIIVIEDDVITSTGFLKFMNEALTLYENEEQVMHISGYMLPVKAKLQELFFVTLASSWGWGTWSRAWKYFNDDAKKLLDDISASHRIDEFTFNNSIPFDGMLHQKASGMNESWNTCWHTSIFLRNGFCLHPGNSMVRNIGHDGTGVHCKKVWWSDIYTRQAITDNVHVSRIKLTESDEARKAVNTFFTFLYSPTLWVRIKEKLSLIMHSITA